MTDKKIDITSSTNDDEIAVGNKTKSDTSPSRRKLLKGAIGTAPIIMTLASRPASAIMCGSAALQSANLSNHDHGGCVCGYSPGGWKTPDSGSGDGDRSQWNAAGYEPGTCNSYAGHSSNCNGYDNDGSSFDAEFGSSPGVPSGLSMLKVLELHGPGTDPYNYAAHMVAALLNAEYFKSLGQNYALQKSLIMEIHNQILTTGYYQPASGAPMDAADIVRWIEATFCGTCEHSSGSPGSDGPGSRGPH